MLGCREYTRIQCLARGTFGNTGGRKVFDQIFPVELTIETIHFRDFFPQLFAIAFGKTAHHVDAIEGSFIFLLHQFENGVDTFLFGVTNESAGVDHCDIAVQFIWIVVEVATDGGKLAK